MENVNQNPLSKHFRHAVLHTKLVSNGKFWREGSIEIPATGEIPVYPMTLKDEITLKTPDALLNGSGVVDVLQSCCPSIKDAWEMPSIDLDALLISIRIATYGETMELDSTCPNAECKEENTYSINLHEVISGIEMPDFSAPVELNDLKIFLKPQKYFDLNKRNRIEFEEQQLLNVISQADNNSDKDVISAQFNTHLTNVLNLNFDSITSSTKKIILNDGTEVTDPVFLKEFYINTTGLVTRKVQERVAEYSNKLSIKPFKVHCPHCNTAYDIKFSFDYANFFG